jgi:hypothetical protein
MPLGGEPPAIRKAANLPHDGPGQRLTLSPRKGARLLWSRALPAPLFHSELQTGQNHMNNVAKSTLAEEDIIIW